MRSHLLLALTLLASPSLAQAIPVPTTQAVAGGEHVALVTWEKDRVVVRVFEAKGGAVDLEGWSGKIGIQADRGSSQQERKGQLLHVEETDDEKEHLAAEQHLGALPAQGLLRVAIQLEHAGKTELFVAFWKDGVPLLGGCPKGATWGPHGGRLVSSGAYEVLYANDLIRIWTYDAQGQPIAPGPRGTANMRVERAGGTFQERMARLRHVGAEEGSGAVGHLEAEHQLGDGEKIIIRAHLTGPNGGSEEFELVLTDCRPVWRWSCPDKCGLEPRLVCGVCLKCRRVLKR